MVLDETEWNIQKIPRVNKSKGSVFLVFFWIFESFRPEIDRESAFYATSNALKTWGI